MKGKFISFEGGEGAGKSTQIERLSAYLEAQNIDVVQTREPGGTPGGEGVRRLLKDGGDHQWDGISEALLLYASRRMLTEQVIKPALDAGKWVICDRYADSSLVYQGMGRAEGLEKILELHQLVLGDFWPDLTFFMDVSPDVGMARAQKRASELGKNLGESDRFERMDLDFHHRIHQGYCLLAKRFSRFKIIDGLQPIDAIQRDILSHITPYL